MVVVLTLWAVLFYRAMTDEITDEVDDSLEDYAEMIIIRSLAGDALPSNDSGSNNQYFIKEISEAEAAGRPAIEYRDEMVYLNPYYHIQGQKRETLSSGGVSAYN